MKKTLLFCLLFMGVRGYGQTLGAGENHINFDTTGYTGFVDYVAWQYAITIDTVHYHHNIWQVGRPQKTVFNSAYSYPNAIVTDTLNPYPINDTSVFVLKIPSPGEDFSTMSFYYQLNIDSGAKATIEVSLDSGGHWANVIDSLPPEFGWVAAPPNLTSSTTGWEEFNLYSTSLVYPYTDTVEFRFTFISDSVFANKDGWMMDNFVICFCWEGIPTIPNPKSLTLYPNPANTELTIRAEGEEIKEVGITNVMGQSIPCPISKTNSTAQIDVSGLAAGMYFVRVNNSVVRKFVKD